MLKLPFFNKEKPEEETIQLRGHHLIMLADYLREGDVVKNREYGQSFYKNLKKTFKKIVGYPEQKIRMISSLDDLCLSCHAVKTSECENASVDLSFLKILDLENGTVYESQTILEKIQTNSEFRSFMEYRSVYFLKKIY